jgi:hypothetical protein
MLRFLLTAVCLVSATVSMAQEAVALRPTPALPPEDINEYVLRCDKKAQQLVVAKRAFLPETGFTASRDNGQEFVIRPDKLTTTGGTADRPLTLPNGSKTYKCQLGKSGYRVVVEPFIANPNPMGQCGAADVSLQLTVSRNGQSLFKKQAFEKCRDGTTVYRFQISERKQTVDVLAALDIQLRTLRVERSYPVTAISEDWNPGFFETLPTGDKNADLFIFVGQLNSEAVKMLLKKGANPNAVDADGHSPLAWLDRKSAKALLGADDERATIEIVNALIQAGANR